MGEHVQHSTKEPKAPYKTASSATAEAQRMGTEKGYPFDVYQCDDCGFWHVGTKRRYRPKQVMHDELGGRVTLALSRENHPRKRNRRKSVSHNIRRALSYDPDQD